MNVNTDPASIPDADHDGDSGEAQPAATKRAPRKRAAKTAAPEAAADTKVEAAGEAAPVAAAPVAEEAPAKPKTPRRRKPAASAEADAAPEQAELPLQAVAADPLPPRAERTPVAEAAADAVSAEASPEAGVGESGEAAEGAEGEEGRSERSRRRSRRDRRRNRQEGGPEGGQEAAGEGAGEAEAGEEGEGERRPAAPAVPAPLPEEVFAQVVSGAFDESAEGEASNAEADAEAGEGDESESEGAEPSGPPKRVLRPEPDAPKLHKVLAQSGIGSRRDMEQAITDGLVTVNGQVAHIGQRISFGDRIALNGKAVKVRIVPPAPRILAYHKPVGEVVTHDDPEHRPTVFRRLPRLPQGKWQSVGRLDLNTEGLLLFTNSGELANQLMHPRFGVEREYAVRVLGTLDPQSKDQLLEGVNIDGQTASFKSIEDGGGEGANHWYRVVITEGRNREVRKLFDAVELTVSRLIRIRYGTVVLPRGLKRGVWVDLDEADVRAIRRLANPGGEPQQPRAERGQNAQNPQQRDRNAPNKQRGDRRPENGPRADRSDNRGGERNDRNERGPRPNPGPQGGQAQQTRPPRNLDNPPPQRVRSENDFDDEDEEIDHSRIPNPLEQTFDKRFVKNPRSPVGGRGFRNGGGGGFGSGGSAAAPRKKGSPSEPDPLQTSVGYIGGDAFHKKGGRGGGFGGGGGGGGGGGFNRGGGGGGGGGRRGR